MKDHLKLRHALDNVSIGLEENNPSFHTFNPVVVMVKFDLLIIQS